MSSFFKIVYVVILGVLFVAFAALADDVYNFYFQKAPGPQTVIQGANGAQPPSNAIVKDGEIVQTNPAQSTQAATPASAAQSTAPAPAPATSPEFKHWEIFGGLNFFNGQGFGGPDSGYGPVQSQSYQATGAAVGLRYHVSKYFAAGTTVMYANNESSSNGDQKQNLKREGPFDVSVEIAVTPIEIELFGYSFIDLTAVGGATTSVNHNTTNVDLYNSTIHDVKSVQGFFGPRIALNLNPTASLFGEWRFFTDGRQSQQVIAGVGIRL